MSPSRLLSRYAPLAAVLAVQAVLVMAAPGGTTTVTNANGSNGSSGGPAAASVGGGVNGGGPGAPGAISGGTGGAPGAGGAGGAGATGPGGTTASGPIANTSTDRSRCDKNGREIGVTTYMPACVPVWSGNNGGATMPGVTGNEIRVVYVVAQANPEVNAILERENLAASADEICQGIQAWVSYLNKRYDFYGRKIVSLDGPGTNAGSKNPNQSSCHYPYFQSQCSLTPPDEKCYRAEADTIAKMHPAIAFFTGDGAMVYRLAQDHIVTATGNLAPDSYYQQLAPYMYGLTNGSVQARLFAEYWCKKLAGKPVQYGGTAPGDVQDPDSNPTTGPPIRKLGISYYLNPADHTAEEDAKELLGLVTGGMCGKKGDAFMISYTSDITTAQQQTNTFIAEMKKNGATDSTCFCDPIAPVFSSKGEEEQNYHPEQVGSGSGLLDYDVLAQLYDQDVWRHTLGLSNIGNALPFAESDAVKAWHDVGNSGEPDKTENLGFTYWEFIGMLLMAAGPDLTPQSIAAGVRKEPYLGGNQYYAGWQFTPAHPYSAEVDVREVYYCPTENSPINNQPGRYDALLDGKRIRQGEFTTGLDGAFPNGLCAP